MSTEVCSEDISPDLAICVLTLQSFVGHWLIDSKISTPMSQYEDYRKSRTSWGINVLGSFCVELEATDGSKGFATGFGGPPACWLVAEHFERFLIGQDPRG